MTAHRSYSSPRTCDRGSPRLTDEELDAFCRQSGIKVYLSTSAKVGDGIDELIGHMQQPDSLGRHAGNGHHRNLQANQGLRPQFEGELS